MRSLSARSVTALLGLGLIAAACTEEPPPPPPTADPSGGTEMSVAVVSYDVVAGIPNRLIAGLQYQVGPEEYELVSFGDVGFDFSYLGTEEQPIQGGEPYGSPATASFLAVPNEDGSEPTVTSDRPILTVPSEARGVYAAYDVTFDRAGFYEATVTADVEGVGTLTGKGAFQVVEESVYPAPGQPAPKTENLTVDSAGAPPEAIDSRAQEGAAIPDPELHRTTIADAIAAGRPALVVFSTPVFCISRFCGPITDVVQSLAAEYGDRADFIHVEIWRDFQGQVVNQAAADWVLRNGDLTEPWVFLIGPDGTIVQRWDNVVTADEMRAALDSLPDA